MKKKSLKQETLDMLNLKGVQLNELYIYNKGEEILPNYYVNKKCFVQKVNTQGEPKISYNIFTKYEDFLENMICDICKTIPNKI